MAEQVPSASDHLQLPPPFFTIGITGHREGNQAFAANRDAIAAALEAIFESAANAIQAAGGRARLVCPLSEGSDLIAGQIAAARGWDLLAPLPFGLALNAEINFADADPAAMLALADRARVFALADQDDDLAALMAAARQASDDKLLGRRLGALMSERAAAASRIVVEQSDLIVAVWDGVTPGALGGTRHTMAAALAVGVPVLWVNAAAPEQWSLLRLVEELGGSQSGAPATTDTIAERVSASLPAEADEAAALHRERWQPRSPRFLRAYRWIEDRFAGKHRPAGRPGKMQRYEEPEGIAAGSAAPLVAAMRALPGSDPGFVDQIVRNVLQRFAWADGISTYLSDAYRGGMVWNFLLSATAVTVGVIYLPFAAPPKWPFALIEFGLLLAIVAVTATGRRQRWHSRWFQTRRVAEYLRHAPILLLAGTARPAGRWPRGKDSDWPERHARQVIAQAGLPPITVTRAYLRAFLSDVLLKHVSAQQSYHHAKAGKLTHVHHGLDRISELSFKLAIVSVATYLVLNIGASLHLWPEAWPHATSKIFTVLGVFFPTLGGALAGIRYFGDFERFAAISEVTAQKLGSVRTRIEALLAGPESAIRFPLVADLAVAVDDIVIAEIESWQAVFASKTITVPA